MNDVFFIECEVVLVVIVFVFGVVMLLVYVGIVGDDLFLLVVGDIELCQFVIFMVGDEVFGVDMVLVQEIICVLEVVYVLLVLQVFLGLVNLCGKVLFIVSLSCIFGLLDWLVDDVSCVVVIDFGQLLGFVVDYVVSVVGVDLCQIEDVVCIVFLVCIELLFGLIKDVGGYFMIMVLDFVWLVVVEFVEVVIGMCVGQVVMDGGSVEEVQVQGGDEL